MPKRGSQPDFKIVVSDKSSESGSSLAPSDGIALYLYAERKENGPVSLRPLNENYIPAGKIETVEIEAFLARYHPEPLIYFNRVLPALEAVTAKIDKAENHLANERYDKAEEAFKDVLAVDAENVKAVFGLGTTYLSSGNAEGATEIFQKIMAIDLAFTPQNARMFNDFGIRMRKAGMFGSALSYYNKALEHQDRDENLRFNLARVCFEMGDLAAADGHLEKALALNPGFTVAARMKKYLASQPKPDPAATAQPARPAAPETAAPAPAADASAAPPVPAPASDPAETPGSDPEAVPAATPAPDPASPPAPAPESAPASEPKPQA
jgi:tetratricopeptide (TPR) repeat protein